MKEDFPRKIESFGDCLKTRIDSLRFLHKVIALKSEYIDDNHPDDLTRFQEKPFKNLAVPTFLAKSMTISSTPGFPIM